MTDPLLAALTAVTDPLTGQPLAASQIRQLALAAGVASFELVLGYPAASQHAAWRERLAQAAQAVPGVREVRATVRTEVAAHAARPGLALLAGIRNVVAVASGKGGVGKSTVAANLALALAAEGAQVGLLDADIYGPSQPMMMGLSGQRPESQDGKTMEPLVAHGVRLMSIGFMVDADQAMIWRGPMATQALEQMLRQTRWGALDYLVIDLPPGTGDVQLTLAQRVPLSGALVVTTPQDIALLDARKAVAMFGKVQVPILGLVENMAVHVCSQCGHEEHVFGAGGGQRYAAQQGIAYLGALPLHIRIREQADGGTPTVAAEPGGELAGRFLAIAREAAARLALQAPLAQARFPTITISPAT